MTSHHCGLFRGAVCPDGCWRLTNVCVQNPQLDYRKPPRKFSESGMIDLEVCRCKWQDCLICLPPLDDCTAIKIVTFALPPVSVDPSFLRLLCTSMFYAVRKIHLYPLGHRLRASGGTTSETFGCCSNTHQILGTSLLQQTSSLTTLKLNVSSRFST